MFVVPKTIQKISVCVISFSLVLSSLGLSTHQTPRTHAQVVPTVEQPGPSQAADVKTSIESTVSAFADSISASALKSLELKEWTVDGVAFALAKKVLQQIVKSTVRWINSGFQGSPAFIGDLTGFLTNIADEIAGEIINGSDIGFLCNPIQIRHVLSISYIKGKGDSPPACTLSGVVSNIEGFLSGNFAAGGFPGFFQVVTNPNNNNIGAALSTHITLRRTIEGQQKVETKKLDWGKGFLSKEECTETLDADGHIDTECRTVTPGHVVADALTFDLSIGKRTLIEADEFNEIISALFAQLAQQALLGVGGLLGLTRTGFSGGFDYGDTSYLDQIGNSAFDTTPGGSSINDAIGVFTNAIEDEEKYRSIQNLIVIDAKSIIERAETEQIDDDGDSCGVNDEIVAGAEDILAVAERNVAEATSTIAALDQMVLEYQLGEEEEKIEILNQFAALQASGVLHDGISNVRAEIDAENTRSTLSSLEGRIQSCPSNSSNSNSSSGSGSGNNGPIQ